jgi:hypothetical protein
LKTSFESKNFDFKNIISKLGIDEFRKLFSCKYNNKYIYIPDDETIYNNVNILTDYFTEKPRIESTGHGENLSPMDYWNKNKYEILSNVIKNKQNIDAFTVREYIYEQITEARMGKISNYWTLLNYFKVKRFLDPSCAWGDRLIAAIAYNCHYTGIDPNRDLIKGHNEIIETFAKDRHKYELIYEPFENVNLTKTYDFILSSPAPFEGDFYGNRDGQSTENYKKFDEWFIKYMMATCIGCYNALEYDGHFLITILDRLHPTKYAIVELLLLSIIFKCKDLHYEGVIGWEASRGKIVPFWVFKKYKSHNTNDKITFTGQLLDKYYNNIYKQLLNI